MESRVQKAQESVRHERNEQSQNPDQEKCEVRDE